MIKALFTREMHKGLNLKLIVIWGVMAVFCIFFFFATGGATSVKEGKLDFMSIMLPQIVFGAWAIMAVYYDMISEDRDYHVLDCILCSGVKKRTVFLSKILVIAVLSVICALIYLMPIAILILIRTGSTSMVLAVGAYFIPLWAYIMDYASIGILVSILARSTKQALICSLGMGLILLPQFFILLVNVIGKTLHLGDGVKDILSMISPSILVSKITDISNTKAVVQGVSFFIATMLVLWIISFRIFTKQDELSY